LYVHLTRNRQIMKKYIYLIIGAILSTIIACVPSTPSTETGLNTSIGDAEIQKIIDLQDKMATSELYKYFRNPNPSYRYRAVMAFASHRDSTAVDSLCAMLKDPIIEVRTAAAYALGQIGSPKAAVRLISAFSGKDTLSVNNMFNATILEAVGKVGTASDLKAIATVKTYRNTDTILISGQAKAIYHMALRGIISPEGTTRMIDLLYLTNTPEDSRLIAASYLARAKDLDLVPSKLRLTEIWNREKNIEIRMALATALGKTKDLEYLMPLKTKLSTETDYRVKCNILRAMENFPYPDVKEILFKYAKDANPHVANVASAAFIKNGSAIDVAQYALMDTITTPWRVRANMNAAVLAHTGLYFTQTKIAFSERIKNNIKTTTDPYAKAAYVAALAQDPYNYYALSQMYITESHPVVKQAILEGQGNILRHPQFFKAFGPDYPKAKGAILVNLLTGIRSKDIGQMAIAAGILKDEKLGFKEWVKDSTIWDNALASLKLPREIEIYNEIKACKAYFEGKNYIPEKTGSNHPIDWSILAEISDSVVAAIKTTQGVIRVRLDKNTAPGSVANFIDLVNKKFYSGKIFHRVVPNFVIQTGCPRGDGWGSLDYTIRTEIGRSQVYNTEGYIGMASAGPNTESTQWFINHSPTMHLNGNYTIFGRVIEGMDVVHKIQQGDKITEIILIK
jgi:cyclophilin family peptidyl-prolyl cis-trans isomerase/HEAT repeat protein